MRPRSASTKAAIHPNQVRTINEAFTLSQEDVEHALAVLAANAMGVGIVDDRMIDEAVAPKARRVLAAAGQKRNSPSVTASAGTLRRSGPRQPGLLLTIPC